jgi:hypothetical protein
VFIIHDSIFKFVRILHINRLVTAVKIYNDRNGHSRLGRRNSDDKQCKKQTIHIPGVEILIKSNEIQVHTVKDQFNAHQHGNKVSSCEKTIYANEEESGGDE